VLDNPADEGGECLADPEDAIAETDESNNDCSDSVTVVAPNLTATRSDDTSGEVTCGSTFKWTIRVENEGHSDAVFGDADIILADELPSGPTCSGATATKSSGVTGTISCTLTATLLECSASSGAVTIPPGEYIDFEFTVEPAGIGTLTNPDGGDCTADPDDVALESDEGANDCNSDSVDVVPSVSDPTAEGAFTGETFFWTPTSTSSAVSVTLAASIRNAAGYSGNISTAI
jgi:subtilase family serine protease